MTRAFGHEELRKGKNGGGGEGEEALPVSQLSHKVESRAKVEKSTKQNRATTNRLLLLLHLFKLPEAHLHPNDDTEREWRTALPTTTTIIRERSE